MIIIGCDYHPGFQQIAFVDTETGACAQMKRRSVEGLFQHPRLVTSTNSSHTALAFAMLSRKARSN